MPTEIFHLKIEDAGPGTFNVYAEDQKAEEVAVAFVPGKLFDDLLKRLQGRSPFQYLNLADQEKDTTQMGELLFNTFLVPPALKRYRDYRIRIGFAEPRIALTLPQTLYYLPWELLRDDQDVRGQFLSMQGSVIRFDESSSPEDTLYGDSPPSTFLFLLASTDQEPLGPFKVKSIKPLVFHQIDPASYPKFQSDLGKTKPLGLVFFGHARIDDNRNGVLVFADEVTRWNFSTRVIPDPRPAQGVGNDLGALKTMKLAYLLACESSWVGNEFPFDSTIIGSILNRTRIAFIIGAQTKINFVAAREFFFGTVLALIDGASLDAAMTAGRKAIFGLNPMTDPLSWRDWWVPVIYARTTDLDVLHKSKPRQEITLPQKAADTESPLAATQPDPTVRVESGQILGAVRRSVSKLFLSDNEASRQLLKTPGGPNDYV